MKNNNRRSSMPFSGKTRQAAEFFQTFYHICPPEAKRGQNIHFLAVTSRCRNLTFKKWSVLKLGQCQNTNKIRVMRLVVGKDSVRFRPSPLIFQISNKNMVRARGLETGFAFQVFSQKLISSPSLL